MLLILIILVILILYYINTLFHEWVDALMGECMDYRMASASGCLDEGLN